MVRKCGSIISKPVYILGDVVESSSCYLRFYNFIQWWCAHCCKYRKVLLLRRRVVNRPQLWTFSFHIFDVCANRQSADAVNTCHLLPFTTAFTCRLARKRLQVKIVLTCIPVAKRHWWIKLGCVREKWWEIINKIGFHYTHKQQNCIKIFKRQMRLLSPIIFLVFSCQIGVYLSAKIITFLLSQRVVITLYK